MSATPGPQAAGGVSAAQSCPARAPAPAALPNTTPELERLDYWLGLASPEELDAPLLTPAALAAHDLALRSAHDGAPRSVDLTRSPDREELLSQLSERLREFGDKVKSGAYVLEPARDPQSLEQLASDPRAVFQEERSLHVALSAVEMSCIPSPAKLRSVTGNPHFDRNRCTRALPQEPIEVLGRYGQLRVARTRYAWGFIAEDATLSPRVPETLAESYRRGHALVLTTPLVHAGQSLPAGTLLTELEAEKPRGSRPRQALIASSTGFASVELSAEQALDSARPLTRRAFLKELFAHVGEPYGWGDENGGRDCSRLVLDVLTHFGLHPPRTSGEQGRAGLFSVEVPPEASEADRLGLLDAAQARGVVLIHFPGHIMVYLGRDRAGVPRALHSFAEYLAPCPEGGETLFEVGRVGVTDLSLGQGTSRRAFWERITRLTVFGTEPGQELLALSHFRRSLPPLGGAPAHCTESQDAQLFRSPREPEPNLPLRVIAVSERDTRPAGLWLIDPKGELWAPQVHELGVGPYARFIQVDKPASGRWTALLSDGERVLACERFRVTKRPKPDAPAVPRAPDAPVWNSNAQWGRASENLYAAFVEQLFTTAPGEAESWSSLTPLLSDPAHNLLFDHLGQHEDELLKLAPDCADLPYFLRAYFAWKLGLPFAYRQCSRGRAGVAPRCGELLSNEAPLAAEDDVSAFARFMREQVSASVHSASARTLPDDPMTDLYPLPLTRDALKPGSVFADPYGHTIVLAKWAPQGLGGSGYLMGADAQPDATVATRRFWRGNFLFTPDTREVGAGFKAHRPVTRDAQSNQVRPWSPEELAKSGAFVPASMAQYQGSQEDFYARMDELIYPRPVALADRMQQLLEALHEQVKRRVEAVQVGEAGVQKLARNVPMPEGYALFETSGPWEDFATPSRDMRLLIALDAVRALPEDVRARPVRYGLSAGQAGATGAQLSEQLALALKARRITYTRSDQSAWELSLADVLARSDALEMGYNPNDCPELRWGAPEGSAERATCQRSASTEQRSAMEGQRTWFRTRTRPARP